MRKREKRTWITYVCRSSWSLLTKYVQTHLPTHTRTYITREPAAAASAINIVIISSSSKRRRRGGKNLATFPKNHSAEIKCEMREKTNKLKGFLHWAIILSQCVCMCVEPRYYHHHCRRFMQTGWRWHSETWVCRWEWKKDFLYKSW